MFLSRRKLTAAQCFCWFHRCNSERPDWTHRCNDTYPGVNAFFRPLVGCIGSLQYSCSIVTHTHAHTRPCTSSCSLSSPQGCMKTLCRDAKREKIKTFEAKFEELPCARAQCLCAHEFPVFLWVVRGRGRGDGYRWGGVVVATLGIPVLFHRTGSFNSAHSPPKWVSSFLASLKAATRWLHAILLWN